MMSQKMVKNSQVAIEARAIYRGCWLNPSTGCTAAGQVPLRIADVVDGSVGDLVRS